MNKVKKLALAFFAAVGMSGCANTPIAGQAGMEATPVAVAEKQVLRPLQSYGSMGGYRYRRFAAVAVSD